MKKDKIKNLGNVSISELFSYDVVNNPGFVTAKVSWNKETREEKRKRKINTILKNPLD